MPTHGNITYLEEETAQADILLAARVARVETDAIMANDMDFHACLGDVSLSISEFKYEQRSRTITNIVLAAASRREASRWRRIFYWVDVDEPQYPIFEGELILLLL